MKILEALLSLLPPGRTPVRNVLVGVHWTAVCSQGCGLASTIVDDGPHGHRTVREVGSLEQMSAQELAQWVLSDNLLEASIGMAAINSLLPFDESKAVEVNAAEVIAREGVGKNIAVVGHFPFVDRLRALAGSVWVIEKKPHEGDLPEHAAERYLPQADIVAITGTALINHSLEQLLPLCSGSSLVMVLGPSTPLSPVLFDHGVHMVSGARVMDEIAALHTIQQGAIFPQVKGVRLFTLSTSSSRK